MWREWLSFSKTEQRGFFVLIGICMCLLLILMVGQWRHPQRGLIVVRQLPNERQDPKAESVLYDTLDVNIASVAEMSSFGLTDRLIVNILKYREAGGYYKNYDDFKKTYGFDSLLLTDRTHLLRFSSDYGQARVDYNKRVKPHRPSIHLYYSTIEEIRTAGCPSNYADTIMKYRDLYFLSGVIKVDSLMQMDIQAFMRFLHSRIKGEKSVPVVKEIVVPVAVDLNRADTADLMQLRGIGQYLATRILDYRQRLGGFVDVRQLMEVNGVNPSVLHDNEGLFNVDSSVVRTISINHSSVELLRKHPYVSFYLAKEIVERRRVKGDFTNLRQIVGLPSYDQANPLLIHYLSLEKN